ncbi:hypothetical protein AOLI_G00328140 [Acnodon oligacanthus]
MLPRRRMSCFAEAMSEYGLTRKILDNPNPVDNPTTLKTTSLRERMSKLGLYGKHSIAHPLLMSCAKYLQVNLANENFKTAGIRCRRWQARRAFETATNNMTDIEKFMVADYLAHSSATAENVVMASLLLKRLLSVSE